MAEFDWRDPFVLEEQLTAEERLVRDAVPGGYRLTGSKTRISSSPIADVFL